jgi:hypothetical protein
MLPPRERGHAAPDRRRPVGGVSDEVVWTTRAADFFAIQNENLVFIGFFAHFSANHHKFADVLFSPRVSEILEGMKRTTRLKVLANHYGFTEVELDFIIN